MTRISKGVVQPLLSVVRLHALFKQQPSACFNIAAFLTAALPRMPYVIDLVATDTDEQYSAQWIVPQRDDFIHRVQAATGLVVPKYSNHANFDEDPRPLENLGESPVISWVANWVARYPRLTPISCADLWWMVLAESRDAGWYKPSRQVVSYFDRWLVGGLPPTPETPAVVWSAAIPRRRRLV